MLRIDVLCCNFINSLLICVVERGFLLCFLWFILLIVWSWIDCIFGMSLDSIVIFMIFLIVIIVLLIDLVD